MEKRKRCSQEDLPPLLRDEYLIKQILTRLPIVSLLRFKTVSKSWYSLIQSSFFINLHILNSSSSSSKFGSFIFLASLDPFFKISCEQTLFLLSSESGSGGCWWSTGDDDQPDKYDDDQMFKVDKLGGSSLVFKLDNLGFPSLYKFSRFSTKIVGSYNGLVCLYDRYGGEKQVSLWNPATRQFRTLPESIYFRCDDNCQPSSLLAFGFDVETKDYKVVLLAGFRTEPSSNQCLCRVQVYSLSTDSWRLCEDIISLPGNPFKYPTEVLYLNGSCFFLAEYFHTKHCNPKNDRLVISFDLKNKEGIIITPIQLPDHHQDQQLHLSCIGDKMALYAVCYHEPPPPPRGTYYYPGGICGNYEDHTIWVLNEQVSSSVNEESSWTKLHSFRIEHERPSEQNLPRGISNDGEFALLETRDSSGLGKKKKMKLYDLATKQVKKNFLSCSLVKSRAIAYTPSLVSIIGGNGEQQLHQHQDDLIFAY